MADAKVVTLGKPWSGVCAASACPLPAYLPVADASPAMPSPSRVMAVETARERGWYVDDAVGNSIAEESERVRRSLSALMQYCYKLARKVNSRYAVIRKHDDGCRSTTSGQSTDRWFTT